MTMFEKIKAMNIDEFSEWFSKYCVHDNDPCINWWNDRYCNNCNPEIARYEDSEIDMEFSWCELHGECKYIKENKVPDTLQMTKLWLESDVD